MFYVKQVLLEVQSSSNRLEGQDLTIFNFLGCLLEFFKDVTEVVVGDVIDIIIDIYLYSGGSYYR